jgi:hypothetical protein
VRVRVRVRARARVLELGRARLLARRRVLALRLVVSAGSDRIPFIAGSMCEKTGLPFEASQSC